MVLARSQLSVVSLVLGFCAITSSRVARSHEVVSERRSLRFADAPDPKTVQLKSDSHLLGFSSPRSNLAANSENDELFELQRIRSQFLPFHHMLNLTEWYASEDKFMYVHIGKTGGTSTKCVLANQNTAISGIFRSPECTLFMKTHEPLQISKKIGGYCHIGFWGICPQSAEFNTYVVTLRNPVQRMVSAFNFELYVDRRRDYCHEKLPEFYDLCFKSADDFLLNGLAPEPQLGNATQECWSIAQNMARGTQQPTHGDGIIGSHFIYNYQFNEGYLHENSNIIGLRTEHFDDDISHLETMLTGSLASKSSLPNKQQQEEKDANYHLLRVEKTKSDGNDSVPPGFGEQDPRHIQGIQNACRVLCNENQSYKRMLYRSENLGDKEVMQAIMELQNICPEEGPELRTDCD